jgi:hypothetical protein
VVEGIAGAKAVRPAGASSTSSSGAPTPTPSGAGAPCRWSRCSRFRWEARLAGALGPGLVRPLERSFAAPPGTQTARARIEASPAAGS